MRWTIRRHPVSEIILHADFLQLFAAYTQGVWDISEAFTLTLGIRYAEDKVKAEENLFRYSETGGDGFLALGNLLQHL